jgi:hypothetical protein
MSNVGPLVEANTVQRFVFGKPQLKELQDIGKRWLGTIYFEQYNIPQKPIPVMPMYRDPESKDELQAAADCLYEVLPTLRTLTTPSVKVALLFHDEAVITAINADDDIRNRLTGMLAGIEWEFGTYDWAEVERKTL